jgi:hypothetical protein
MRTVIARIFDYSLDGIIAEEGTSFFDFCRLLPDDPIQIAHERDFYANADLHIVGRKHAQEVVRHLPAAVDHPYAGVLNAARKVIFSQTVLQNLPCYAEASNVFGSCFTGERFT